MDRFSAALLATSLVFFWCFFFLCLIAVSLSGFFPYSIVMVVVGAISLAGCSGVIRHLKGRVHYWFLGIPLAIVIAGGMISACLHIVGTLTGSTPADPFILSIPSFGIASLLGLAPCAVLLLVACSPLMRDRLFFGVSVFMAGVAAILSLAMLGDMVFQALHLYDRALFGHPWGEGFLFMNGIAGCPFIGLVLILFAYRYYRRDYPEPAGIPANRK